MDSIALVEIPCKVQRTVREMLSKHNEEWSGKLGEIQSLPHQIKLTAESIPPHSQPNRTRLKKREHDFSKVKRLLDAGVIEPARLEWATLAVFVRRPDGSLCLLRRLQASEGP